MKVKLISKTGNDNGDSLTDIVAYTARVSNPANQHNKKTAAKLLAYLKKHKHWSTFEMVDLTFEIECTRDIARQMLRHRSFSFQEFSQRYAEIEEFETSIARLQDDKNRQNSLDTDDALIHFDWDSSQQHIIRVAMENYQRAINKGIAKEVARKLLPEGLTMSRLYMKGSLRSWLHYLEVRTHESTQKEHRDVALAIKAELMKLVPEVFDEN